MNCKTCVIIPCGGKGGRLGLPYPKELLTIDFEKALIDHCFDLLDEHKEQVRIVIVINDNKLALIKYLRKYTDAYNVVFIYQKEQMKEFIGAIESARSMFLEHNIVLLPDTIIKKRSDQKNLIESTLWMLKHTPFIFWGKREGNKELLSREGALEIDFTGEYPKVMNYMDKPGESTEGLNGYWGAFAFNKPFEKEVLSILRGVIEHNPNISFKKTILHECPMLAIEESFDLGTWKSITRYIERNRKE